MILVTSPASWDHLNGHTCANSLSPLSMQQIDCKNAHTPDIPVSTPLLCECTVPPTRRWSPFLLQ